MWNEYDKTHIRGKDVKEDGRGVERGGGGI